jgi:NAD(P)-dependent dehydrogenase (short-subunit alcohol dehydrogenase family)
MTSQTETDGPSPRDRGPRTIVLTGATSGIGKAAAKELARRGARLLLVGRSRERCQSVMAECAAETGNPLIDYVAGDLSTVREVRRVAAEIKRRLDHIDTLVNNAGGTFPTKRTETDEGFEISFVLQYLSRHVLTEELLDPLRASAEPLVMTTSAGGTCLDKQLDLDDLQSERDYGRFRLMARAGALNDLHTHEQSRRHQEITFINYGPGLVRTNTSMTSTMARIFFQTIGRLFSRSPQQAGAEMAELAAGGHEGGYYGPGLRRNEPVWRQVDADRAATLWNRTEELLKGLPADLVGQATSSAPPVAIR